MNDMPLQDIDSPRSVTFRDGGHMSTMLELMNGFRTVGLLCDVDVHIGQLCLSAHRAVLAACSPYFRAMFTAGLSETFKPQVELKDMDTDAVKALVDFAYTSVIEISEENVQEILYASDLLEITSVKHACTDFLSSHMDPINCLGVYRLAKLHSCAALVRRSLQYAATHLPQVCMEEEFLKLSFGDLCALLQNQYVCATEEIIAQAIFLWVCGDYSERRPLLHVILELTRLSSVSQHLLQTLLTWSGPKVQRESGKPQDWPQAAAEDTTETSGRPAHKQTQILLAMGGESQGVCLDTMECYNLEDTRWSCCQPSSPHSSHAAPSEPGPSHLASMATARTAMAVVSQGPLVYVLGGNNSTLPLDTAEYYSCLTNTWKSLPAMTTARNGAAAVILNDRVYAVGGSSGLSYLSSVEVLNESAGCWDPVPSMKEQRAFCQAACIGGFLYAIGGSGGQGTGESRILDSMERYSSSTNQWVSVAAMQVSRAYFGATTYCGAIYVGGGYSEHVHRCNAIEKYDPSTNQWTEVTTMRSPRSSFSMAALGSSLYLVGGFNGRFILNSVERYDLEECQWHKVMPMSSRRYSPGVVALVLPANSRKLTE